jgi:hypothetical protein
MSEPSSSSRTVKLETLLQVLQNGQIEVQGLLPNGSNYTFFAMVSRGEMRTFAVYKPTRGEQPCGTFLKRPWPSAKWPPT